MVIHDIVHNEQSALDATRQTFIRALVDIQTGI
jgi:hypothetical protein